jgi:aminopeptidase N
MNKHKIIIALAIATSIFMGCTKRELPTEGVSTELAKNRKATIDSISYQLHFAIPDIKNNPINGTATISFVAKSEVDAIIDFKAEPNMLGNMLVNGKSIEFLFVNGHIVIPIKHIKIGKNSVTIEFVANNGSLNRNDEFLYTLLVPDRASTVFPCFDQPDMKATFELSLTIPANWVAVSNGIQVLVDEFDSEQKTVKFASTLPISTYLFAFATGKFETIKQSVNGFEMTLFHRETDKEKLKQNVETIFSAHEHSVKWLENYTQILYPFGKLDFVLIPGFQYSGMEHSGAIFYRDSRLLLDKNPTVTQKLQQANLIAHEVAHQWFGNLVTMRWFNDVWLKEVFAGLMADKIVNPMYPEINHELNFLLSHNPRAYSVDRTQGANPIVQNLDNMLDAGSLYGDIIYHKAPIMMQQLELMIGEDNFKTGIRNYLQNFYLANANWDELVAILDEQTSINLMDWSDKWTKTIGRPIVRYYTTINESESKVSIDMELIGSIACPPMQLSVSNVSNGNECTQSFVSTNIPTAFNCENVISNSIFTVNSNGKGYGCFTPDSSTLNLVLSIPIYPKNDLARASLQVSVHEMFLEGFIELPVYFNYLVTALENESEPQIQKFTVNSFATVWKYFCDEKFKDNNIEKVENILWKQLNGEMPVSQKKNVFSLLTSIFQTPIATSKIYDAWQTGAVSNFSLSEDEKTLLAIELMIRKPDMYDILLDTEMERITNPDRKKKFAFVAKAASPRSGERVEFFDILSEPSNRKPEPWVAEGLRILHHPLRSNFSIRFIEPSLNMLPEIQRTGDIFFPKDWLDATLSGHSSVEAYKIVDEWLKSNPNLPENLRLKVLQSADLLDRSSFLK